MCSKDDQWLWLFFNTQLPLMTPSSLQGGYRQLEKSKRCILEELALIEGVAHVFEDRLPRKRTLKLGSGSPRCQELFCTMYVTRSFSASLDPGIWTPELQKWRCHCWVQKGWRWQRCVSSACLVAGRYQRWDLTHEGLGELLKKQYSPQHWS